MSQLNKDMNNLRLEYRDPTELTANPANWRKHPQTQTNTLKDVIGEVGWAGALLYNEKTGRLIDGHARKELFEGERVPVLIGSWDEEQEKLILATLDPLAAIAGTDQEKLDELLAEIEANSEHVQQFLDSISSQSFPDGEEFDESAADDVKMLTCPHCGKEFPQ